MNKCAQLSWKLATGAADTRPYYGIVCPVDAVAGTTTAAAPDFATGSKKLLTFATFEVPYYYGAKTSGIWTLGFVWTTPAGTPAAYIA